MCVLGGDWRFPDEGDKANGKGKAKAKANANAIANANTNAKVHEGDEQGSISDDVKDVVRRCLKVEPAERPDIDELIDLVEAVVERLPPDYGDGHPDAN